MIMRVCEHTSIARQLLPGISLVQHALDACRPLAQGAMQWERRKRSSSQIALSFTCLVFHPCPNIWCAGISDSNMVVNWDTQHPSPVTQHNSTSLSWYVKTATGLTTRTLSTVVSQREFTCYTLPIFFPISAAFLPPSSFTHF